jgi:hypothetical protein
MPTMRVDVLLFASLKDDVGPCFAVEAAHPAFARLGRRTLVAVNEAYADERDPLRPGDVVAVLPPVAGG